MTIDPFDVRAQADAIYEALTMTDDVKRRWIGEIRSWVREHDLAWWINGLLHDLESCLARRDGQGDAATKPVKGA